MPPTPKQLANLRPGVGRPFADTAQISLTLSKPLLTKIDQIALQQGWKRSYIIDLYIRKGMGLAEFGGYSNDDLDLIAKGVPFE